MDIPNLDNLIKALECDLWPKQCEHCPYGYQKWDDNGDYPDWWCDDIRKDEEVLFYLKLFQHLIKEQENDKQTI